MVVNRYFSEGVTHDFSKKATFIDFLFFGQLGQEKVFENIIYRK